MLKKFLAFTLSEVLLVAAVIGVVAALTVPNIKRSYDDRSMISKAKAAFAKLDAAMQQVEMGKALSTEDTEDVSKRILNQMSEHLKLLANCGSISNNNYCFNKENIINGSTLNNYNLHSDTGKCASAILNDGTEFAVCVVSKKPVQNSSVLKNQKYYGYIVADVNGAKNLPNERAKDTYFFVITEDGGLAISNGTGQVQYESTVFRYGDFTTKDYENND